jgi:hypothetical protein
MDGTAAINHNLEALRRILAGLVAMAGLAVLRRCGDAAGTRPEVPAEGEPRRTLPRHLHRAILRLLRPAEAAARRLIIASARGLVVVLPPPRKREAKPITAEPFLRRFGIAVVVSPADFARAARILPRLRGRGTAPQVRPTAGPRTGFGGGGGGVPRTLTLPLFDPLRCPQRIRSRTVPAHAAPRILFSGATKPFSLPPLPSPDDPIDATRLNLRLATLAAALDDLPGQARRFARWKARQQAERQTPGRIAPLRPGRPPGGRLSRFDPSARRSGNIREVDEVLAHAHALAIYALRYPDTS